MRDVTSYTVARQQRRLDEQERIDIASKRGAQHVEGDLGEVLRFLRAIGQMNRMRARREQQNLALKRRRARNKVARRSRKINR